MNDSKPNSLRDDLLHEIAGEQSSPLPVNRATLTLDSEPAPAIGTEPSAGQAEGAALPMGAELPSRSGTGPAASSRPGFTRGGSGASTVGPTCRDLFASFPEDAPVEPASTVPTRDFLGRL